MPSTSITPARNVYVPPRPILAIMGGPANGRAKPNANLNALEAASALAAYLKNKRCKRSIRKILV